MPGEVGFTKSDVLEGTNIDPWQRRDDFSDEVNEDEMADVAAQYARAAGEAESAGDLARVAGEQGAESGSVDGQELIDKEQRGELTSNDLGGNGEDMDAVVGNVMRGIGLAQDCIDENEEIIDGGGDYGGGLDQEIEDLNTDAERDLGNVRSALERTESGSILLDSIKDAPKVTYGDITYTAVQDESGWDAPWDLKFRIRQKHLEAAIEATETADGNIDDAIEQYRSRMAELAYELEQSGFDTSEDPGGLWSSPEMAEYNGERLNEELQKDEPDPHALGVYSVGLDSALDDIYDENGEIREDFDSEDSAAARYVHLYVGELDAEALSALGHLDPDDADGPVGTAQQAVANGINTVMNPAAGGNAQAMPAGVVEYMDGYDERISDSLTASGEKRDIVAKFDGFAGLMGNATVASGDEFSTAMADVAVDVQKAIDNENEEIDRLNNRDLRNDHFGNRPNISADGVGGLLSAASLNSGATAEWLGDEDRVKELLGAGWGDSSGAGDFVTSGTTLPEDVSYDDKEAERYFDASFNVLTGAIDQSDALKADVLGVDGPAGGTGLQEAIADTAVRNMDFLSQISAEPESGMVRDLDDLYGRDYPYGFELAQEDQAELFTMMQNFDDDVTAQFEAGVGAWQYSKAYEAFEHGDGDDAWIGSMVTGVSTAQGLVHGGVEAADTSLQIDPNNVKTSILSGVAFASGLGGPAAGAAGTALAEGLRNTVDVGSKPPNPYEFEHRHWGTHSVEYMLATAAQDAGYKVDEDTGIPDVFGAESEDGKGPRETTLRRQFDNLEDNFDFADPFSINEGYDSGRKPFG
ncbi:hypothetical protein [Streptomyces xiaopingdaonensis]|uniref:hypothetical protein n=1 Tax=Streptomyces xiaopingdaonensis TaxID=1565415 RepID=UPI00031464DA|nr:hypothetical protein [Streptomyces xiaopingdaonensis]